MYPLTHVQPMLGPFTSGTLGESTPTSAELPDCPESVGTEPEPGEGVANKTINPNPKVLTPKHLWALGHKPVTVAAHCIE